MNRSFEYITTLEYRLKAANARILAFESGEKYIRMQEEYLKELRCLEKKIRKLEDELSQARRFLSASNGLKSLKISRKSAPGSCPPCEKNWSGWKNVRSKRKNSGMMHWTG